jgi:hypothetical protein
MIAWATALGLIVLGVAFLTDPHVAGPTLLAMGIAIIVSEIAGLRLRKAPTSRFWETTRRASGVVYVLQVLKALFLNY